MIDQRVPVITIDGPSGSGKGTISALIARELGWHMLDSGALYRLVGLAAKNHAITLEDTESLATLARHLDVQFKPKEGLESEIFLEGEEVDCEGCFFPCNVLLKITLGICELESLVLTR